MNPEDEAFELVKNAGIREEILKNLARTRRAYRTTGLLGNLFFSPWGEAGVSRPEDEVQESEDEYWNAHKVRLR